MTIQERLDRWQVAGAISGEQYVALRSLARKERFSVFLELNALLYLGVVAFIGGLGWTVHTYFTQLGDAAILAPLTAALAGCLWYSFSRGAPYSSEQVASPTFAFDYVLYLACLIFAVELGYVEFRFHLLKENWDGYLLASAVAYVALAYRFDNRFVLSLALSSLAGWFGVRLSYVSLHLGVREYALAYGVLVAFAGFSIRRAGIKAHFFDTYLHVAANAVFVALVSGVNSREMQPLWFVALLGASTLAIHRGVRFKRFAFVLYGAIYGYAGLTAEMFHRLSGDKEILTYLVASAAVVVVSLVAVSRQFGREE
jgi:hypothetical protein